MSCTLSCPCRSTASPQDRTYRSRNRSARAGSGSTTGCSKGIASAFDQARAAAGDNDIAIVGGADIVRQCLNAGLVEEVRLHLIPILLGGGARLFDGVDPATLRLEPTAAEQADGVVHLRFRVR